MKKVAITGVQGLIGSHAHARLHAANCAARFAGKDIVHDIVAIDHALFSDPVELAEALEGVDSILHFAGVNRGPENEVEEANPKIADDLIASCIKAGISPHIIYANSTHSRSDSAYGRSKRVAGEKLENFAERYTDLTLPHIFGEGARPYYNNVTATLVDQLLKEEPLTINPEGQVSLLHAGEAAQIAVDAMDQGHTGIMEPEGLPLSIADLAKKLQTFHSQYVGETVPELSTVFDVQLFNTYRSATYPEGWPRQVELNVDDRGVLFEAVKASSGQTFMSVTKPGIVRGDHFHINKIERFLVIQGEAMIRIRHILGNTVREFRVCGEKPVFIDMPTLHTHNIENIGSTPLLTMFWSNEIFDPEYPDTYADKV
ncbi:UDP-2-acetamido-2,6-beta-L-arabino-hexul-4-ose reductase [Parasphingorhabdus marina DSM 22363]|uniref:UDP-2-acetamido-2,6-beta-L-arabino-hexul-4-ose reductase n=1 Tax=Parasphingorhabdus marina DSM 22363 TaxID=1123272 RepID=A0A1N6HQH7_9SPHN|nr:NAD-dependent epimerase/dehydratase family protein [Parasphingorhabdus marina]SIO22021.1 UDP-2-acetamido-2,6-beta-L-arabino-hexul-4-ose reductase [Parasphingorhabdus marina DSM 22363]